MRMSTIKRAGMQDDDADSRASRRVEIPLRAWRLRGVWFNMTLRLHRVAKGKCNGKES
jgi:hypothetical protein